MSGRGSEPVIDISHIAMFRCASADSLADFLPVNRDRLVRRDIKAAYDKTGRTFLRAAVRGNWAGHRRDTGGPQKN